jgi:hypothetical protein
MGEYAKRISDGQEVKIGTCETMYYLRLEDVNKVQKLPHSLDPAREKGLFFRLPFPDEDSINPGDYSDPFRCEQLYIPANDEHKTPRQDFAPDELAPGTIQLHHACGLLLNVPCYHGARLPDVPDTMKVFWNGKTPAFLQLAHIKTTLVGTRPTVRCVHCGDMWSFDWVEILPYLRGELRERLSKCAEM